MNITNLTNLGGAAGLGIDPSQTGAAAGSGSSVSTGSGMDFGATLKQAAGSLAQLSGTADQQALALATGAPVDVHQVMLSMQQASLGFQMAMQVRDKLVDAYQEVMRMSV